MNKPPDDNPLAAMMLLSRAQSFLQRKQFEQALADLDEALRRNPRLAEALMIRAAVRVELGKYREALADVERRLQLPPPDLIALLTRGNLRAQLGELEAALADFTEFLRQQPTHVLGLRARALTLARLQRFDEALPDLNEALRADPGYASAWHERGRVHQQTGRFQAAVADYEKSLELAPNDPSSCNQFAWMLAACPKPEYRNGPRAVELARHACELTNWQDANLLDTLAAAYAECGRFDEALSWATKALQLADARIEKSVREHVQLFRNRQPARFQAPQVDQPSFPNTIPSDR